MLSEKKLSVLEKKLSEVQGRATSRIFTIEDVKREIEYIENKVKNLDMDRWMLPGVQYVVSEGMVKSYHHATDSTYLIMYFNSKGEVNDVKVERRCSQKVQYGGMYRRICLRLLKGEDILKNHFKQEIEPNLYAYILRKNGFTSTGNINL